MNREEYWQQFESAPPIDCMKMKHDLQARIYEETKDMSWVERREYFRKGSDEYRRIHAQIRTSNDELTVHEDPAEYLPKEP